MVDKEKLKKRAASEIEKMDEAELERMEKDESRLRDWLKGVLKTAWDVIKSAIGSFLAGIFGGL